MLVVTQKEDTWITIQPTEGVDLSLTLCEAFAHGPITVKLVHVGHRRVRLGIEAPSSLKVLRSRAATEVGPRDKIAATIPTHKGR